MMNLTFKAPQTADEAIAFALENLQTYEVADFLRDYKEGHSLEGWMAGLAESVSDALNMYIEKESSEIAARMASEDQEADPNL